MSLAKILAMFKSHFLVSFWIEYPALLYGTSCLLGVYFSLAPNFFLIFPLCFLSLPFCYVALYEKNGVRQFLLSLMCLISLWSYTSYFYQFPVLPPEGLKGKAHLSLLALKQQSSSFGKRWIYEAEIKQFFPDQSATQSVAKGIKCSFSIPMNDRFQRPCANQDYVVHATLKQTPKGQYILKIKSQEKWHGIKHLWSLAEKRYQAKEWLKTLIHRLINHSKSADFLAGLATGEFDDRSMQMDFARYGLQHIMAISGFHFAILAAILGFLFRFFFSSSLASFLMIGFLTVYFCFLGWSASIFRSWMMITIALLGPLFEKSSNALNILGLALIVSLLCDPLLAQTLGFQFSFLVTAAILVLYPSMDYYLMMLLPKRPLSQIVEMDRLNQHGYYILSLFRQGLALTFAVNSFAWPLTLYYFHQVPWMSLLYNLFFPTFVSLSLFLLLIGLILHCISPPLASPIHAINSHYTKWILSLTSNLPTSLDIYWRVDYFPSWFLVIYLTCLMGLSLFLKSYKETNQEN